MTQNEALLLLALCLLYWASEGWLLKLARRVFRRGR
jgi:hypothetical protein